MVLQIQQLSCRSVIKKIAVLLMYGYNNNNDDDDDDGDKKEAAKVIMNISIL